MYSDASMNEPVRKDTSPIRRLLDSKDWGEIHLRLVDFAESRCGKAEQADDLAQGAIARVFAHDSKWDPAKEPDVVRYLMSVVNSLLANERRSAAEKRNVRLEKSKREAERVVDDRSFSEDKLAEVTLFERRMALLRLRLAQDVEATRILELTAAGEDTPADLCRATGWSLSVVNAARLRMSRRAVEVAEELREAEDDAPEEDEAD
jgi:DNA-directed RNA polymerase specialized sigma24 family protein